MSHRALPRRRLPLRLLAAAAALATAGTLAACGGDSGAGTGADENEKVELTYVSYGGTGQDGMIKNWQQPYTALHPNVTFVNASPPDAAQVKAQVQAGVVQWDLVSTAPWLASQNCGTLYEKLTVPDVDPAQFGPGVLGECHIPDFAYSLVFAYNAEKWPDPATAPKSIKDFFDTARFPGKRGVVPALQDGILEWALMADGVAPDQVYPVDVPRALAKWESIRSSTTWAANVGALLQLVTSKQVDMQIMVQARNQAALDAGAKIVPVWDITMTSVDGLAIPKGSPKKAAAERFMSFILKPEQQQKISEAIGVAPSNLLSKPNYTENGAKINTFGPANTGKSVPVDAVWWGKNWNQISADFTKWLNA
ncbi:extracellular solute-binding protein [Dactylosporangium sp. NPDC005572]|uniref:extracellular solute-binding protein n=1 Tax=Dactylosporangium sp. NPDC005572 TaxID=3156889 RepID=UPI0033B25146